MSLTKRKHDISFHRALIISPSNTKNKMPMVLDCGEFGHACFGGYGKRAQMAVDDREQLGNVVPLDPTDYKTLQIFQQLCSLPPEQYSRMVPIFRRLVGFFYSSAQVTRLFFIWRPLPNFYRCLGSSEATFSQITETINFHFLKLVKHCKNKI